MEATIWKISKYVPGNGTKRLHTYREYNQTQIEKDFHKEATLLNPGEELEFWRSDNKYAYESILAVENRDGELYSLHVRGEKVYYKKWDNRPPE